MSSSQRGWSYKENKIEGNWRETCWCVCVGLGWVDWILSGLSFFVTIIKDELSLRKKIRFNLFIWLKMWEESH